MKPCCCPNIHSKHDTKWLIDYENAHTNFFGAENLDPGGLRLFEPVRLWRSQMDAIPRGPVWLGWSLHERRTDLNRSALPPWLAGTWRPGHESILDLRSYHTAEKMSQGGGLYFIFYFYGLLLHIIRIYYFFIFFHYSTNFIYFRGGGRKIISHRIFFLEIFIVFFFP